MCLPWFSTQFHSLRNSISHAWSASCLTLGVSYPTVFGPVVTVAGAPDSDLPTKSIVISFPLLRPLRPVGLQISFPVTSPSICLYDCVKWVLLLGHQPVAYLISFQWEREEVMGRWRMNSMSRVLQGDGNIGPTQRPGWLAPRGRASQKRLWMPGCRIPRGQPASHRAW